MIGCQILKRQRAVSLELARQFLQVPVANVSDCMSRMTAGGARLRPMHDGTAMAGPAFTIKTRPGDNLLIHKALKLAQPGDVIVVDAGGDLTNALIGEIMVGEAKLKGFGGIVINGAIRDSAVIRKDGFPVFAAGVTHRGPYKDGPGEINVPIAIDGMVCLNQLFAAGIGAGDQLKVDAGPAKPVMNKRAQYRTVFDRCRQL